MNGLPWMLDIEVDGKIQKLILGVLRSDNSLKKALSD